MNSLLTKEDVSSILNNSLSEDDIERWWDMRMLQLDRLSPNEMWELGHYEKVIKAAIDFQKIHAQR